MPDRCCLCPRRCGADRGAGEHGHCGADGALRIALADLHFWEEPPLTGTGGAGAVFFTGCPLQCVYCQNWEISRGNCGTPVTVRELAALLRNLQERGAVSIDLVTGTPYVPEIVDAVHLARRDGLHLPVIWNSSGYERVRTLKMLEGTADIYLPDFKYWEDSAADVYSHAPDYRRMAKAAIREMVRQQPVCELEGGILHRGVIVRHLLLPGRSSDARRILHWLKAVCGDHIFVSLMRQYTPAGCIGDFPELHAPVPGAVYDRIARYAEDLAFQTLYLQEEGCADAGYIPDFSGRSG